MTPRYLKCIKVWWNGEDRKSTLGKIYDTQTDESANFSMHSWEYLFNSITNIVDGKYRYFEPVENQEINYEIY